MLRLKDIAAAMDDCHLRTASRWWKKLDAECAAAGLPRVGPDVTGHGANKWHPATAERLLKLWADYYRTRGITARTARRKFRGLAPDPDEASLFAWAASGKSRKRQKK
jgi:hypothetical protein